MRFYVFVSVAVLLNFVSALPNFSSEAGRKLLTRATDNVHCRDGIQIPRLFKLPPQPADNYVSKKIPDAKHPFKAPRRGDIRGPCPGLNTLANHGYIDRSGVDTAENIILASMEGFGMERDFAAFATAFAVLGRGNANTAKLSIGGPSASVPPLPGCIDGPTAKGLSGHGRFEGDVSMTRLDAGLGNNVVLNQTAFNNLLQYINKYGDDGPDGPKTLLSVKTLQEIKFDLFNDDQKKDKQFNYQKARQITSFAEATFSYELMQDGRINGTSVKQLKLFFEQETFGPDYHRRNGPADLAILGARAAEIRNGHPVPAGANDADGNYILQTPPITNFPCDGYTGLAESLPYTLNNVTSGILGKNIQFMLDTMLAPFHALAGCARASPAAQPGS